MTVVGQRSFTDLGTPLAEVPFCVLDLETTGVGPDVSQITEIGAVKFEGGIETGRFQTLVNPGLPIPPQITVITGITQAMVIDAPMIGEALPSFLEFLGDAVIVGHNVSFDISFLNAASLRLGYGRLPHKSTDTLRLARRLVQQEVRNLRLSSLAAHFRSPTSPTHRALDDAVATAHVFWCLLERAGSIGVTHLDDLLSLPSIKGSRAIGKLDLTEDLPRRPGVYEFLDATGSVIYVGKATNLRARVRSYFAGDTRRKVDDMLRELTTIRHRTTSSAFEASIVEIRRIDEARPIYNKRSKPPKSLHWVRLSDEKYPRLVLARKPGDGIAELGPFRSRRAAEQVMHALWDGTKIRRCGSPCKGERYGELGMSVCPCDGGSDGSYTAIVADVLRAMDGDPQSVFDGIGRKMHLFARHHRFEDAAAVRDRWTGLARAIHERRVWDALGDAGVIEACDASGSTFVIDAGRLATSYPTGSQAPLPTAPRARNALPTSMAELDEAILIWNWLTGGDAELVAVSGSLTLPASPIPDIHDLQATGAPGSTEVSGLSRTTPSSVRTPSTRTSERKPPTRIGSKPVTTMTWVPTNASG